MKFLALFISLTFLSVCSAQSDLYLRSFVKEDTVQLRWFPANAKTFSKGLIDGYTVTRVGSGQNTTEEYIIKPLEDRIGNYLNSSDSLTAAIADYVNELFGTGQVPAEALDMSYGMLLLGSSTNRSVAEICGVYWEDLAAGENKYSYTVALAESDIVSNVVAVSGKKLSKNQDCSELFGESRIDLKEVYLKWEAKELNPWYGGYNIYKSSDKENYEKMNKVALYHFSSEYEENKTIIDFVDTNVVEGETYYYKVIPVNHFADNGEHSNVVEVYIQKRLEGFCQIDEIISNEYEREIKGGYRGKSTDEIKEYLLYRSDVIDSQYVQINQVTTTDTVFQFTHTANLLSGDRHFFKVAAVSVDGDTSMSYPKYYFTLDQEPPGIPTDFEGVIDTSGLAKLSWTAPNDEDIIGYRIYRANQLKEEFVEVTTRLSTELVYFDSVSLNNLTSEIYYKIRTVDANYNNSPLSAPILLLKPDTIAPVPSLIRSFDVKEEGVQLGWSNSPSEDVDVQYLIRKFELKIDTLLVFENELSSYLDTSCVLGKNYSYLLVTADKAKNVSPSESLQVTYEIGYRPAPKQLTVEKDIEQKLIILNWAQIMEPIYSVQIYRAKNDGKFRLHKTLRENTGKYEDKDLNINNTYSYKIKVVYQSGISSKMSEIITIVY